MLIDRLAVSIKVRGERPDQPSGAVHAVSVFRSYAWLAGAVPKNSFALRDIPSIYGVPVWVTGRRPIRCSVARDTSAQGELIARCVEDAPAGVDVVARDDFLGKLLQRRLGDGAVVRRDEPELRRSLGNDTLVVVASLDPTPGSTRPWSVKSCEHVYSLDDPAIGRYLPRSLVRVLRIVWVPFFARMTARLIARRMDLEERRLRSAFVQSLHIHKRRFAFAPRWSHAND